MISFSSFVTLTTALLGVAFVGAFGDRESDYGERGNLRNPGALAGTADCHRCDGSNPCLHRKSDDPFYFTHCDDDKYVQCSEWPSQCFDMKCAPGSKWYDSVMTCCPESDVPCQIGISRVDTNLDVGIPLDDVTGAVTAAATDIAAGKSHASITSCGRIGVRGIIPEKATFRGVQATMSANLVAAAPGPGSLMCASIQQGPGRVY
eukprot:CAMPEP_0113563568 /NCGR_PEP_ID=MMETSP0015_2-20120614/21140_1 /TAXON_ID=2838 /ORGANISM="Odontella" /LENGTH=204 /DNA_ID=CAMNT_0000465561 /DNA_START=199 /DNA_END=814 /DNA_ORIENTATION=- /assembly_acc=CAM_ASM_000160